MGKGVGEIYCIKSNQKQVLSRISGPIPDPLVPQTCTAFGRRTMCTSRWPLPSGRPPPLIPPVRFGALGEEGGCGCGSVVMVVIPRCPHCSNEGYPGKYAVILRPEFHYQSVPSGVGCERKHRWWRWANGQSRCCGAAKDTDPSPALTLHLCIGFFSSSEVLLLNKQHHFPVPSAQP